MSSIEGILGGLAKEQFGLIIGIGVGTALASSLEPLATDIRQGEFEANPLLAPDGTLLAAGVAQGQVDPERAAQWASQGGYSKEAFDALVNIANTGPALGYAFNAWRRGELTDEQFTTAMRRGGLETQWYKAMRALKEDRLDMGALATAIHRGIMHGEGLIIREPPQTDGRVPHVPQSDLDPAKEAAAHGFDRERLRVLVGNTGLPPGLIEMLRLLNMGKVTTDDVQRAVAQSNLRNEYMDVVLALRRRLLTPHEYEEAALRGVLTNAQADAGAALHGMEKEDAKTLFELLGRPLAVHQITTGLARGGKYGGSYDTVPEPYQDAIRRSSIRPEYAHLAYANRYTLPGPFVLRALAQGGDLTHDETHTLLLETGWKPDLAAKVAARWTGGAQGKPDAHVAKAETQLWTALHKSYVDDATGDTKAHADLTALGVAAAAIPEVLRLWGLERALVRSLLNPLQIRKAVGQPGKDRAWALARLEELGYTADDAGTFLDE